MNKNEIQHQNITVRRSDSTSIQGKEYSESDTLLYPCLKGINPYPKVEDFHVGFEMDYFQQSPYWHTEIQRNSQGIQQTKRVASFWHSDWIGSSLFLCFVVLMTLIRRNGTQLLQQAKGFFLSPTNAKAQFNTETNLGTYTPFICTFILSYISALLMLWSIQPNKEDIVAPISTLHLIGIYTAIWICYFIVKNFTYIFVDGIFFDKIKIYNWKKYRSLLLTAETLILFIFSALSILLDFSYKYSLLSVILIVTLFKVFHSFKSFQIFFKQKYGSLHLIMYFCALELVPIMVILRILSKTTDYLIVKI